MLKRRTFSHQQGPRPVQNAAQRVRAELGLTQNDLAHLLEVSRSAVAMDERGERSLPWPNAALYYALQVALNVPPPPPDALPPPALSAANRADLDFYRQGLALQVHPLAQKLRCALVPLAQARRWQQVLPALRAAFAAANAGAEAHAWLDTFERRAARTERTAGGPLAQLQTRLAAVAFELAELDRLLAAPLAA